MKNRIMAIIVLSGLINTSYALTLAQDPLFGGGQICTGSSPYAAISPSGDKVYLAGYESEYWRGFVTAYPRSESGALGTALWDAHQQLDQTQPSQRLIAIYQAGSAVPFLWASLDSPQQSLLANSATVEFLRGRGANPDGADSTESDQAQWLIDNNFRVRTSKLGDIAGSSPIYVGAPGFAYQSLSGYDSFQTSLKNRSPMIYVGANDGMVHGFDASTGEEKMAYIPGPVIGQLPQLTDPAYSHRNFVNGPLDIFDGQINNTWRSVLVGGLGSGGQGFYGLDVTNPVDWTDANAVAGQLLWEFTDRTSDGSPGSSELGFSYGQPVVALANDNQWYVFMANGYNNDQADGSVGSGRASLLVIRLSDGQLVETLDTKVGNNNGLATPTLVDSNNDLKVDFAYAGDLKGNLWKFDLRDPALSNWSLFPNNGNPVPLFEAQNSSGTPQPITSAPAVTRHPIEGFLVVVGTGKYLEASDNQASGPTQSIYGIWDRNQQNNAQQLSPFNGNNPQPSRATLLQQQVTGTTVSSGLTLRTLTNNAMAWLDSQGDIQQLGWYLDLPSGGERVISPANILGRTVVVNSIIPAANTCPANASGWTMTLQLTNGGRPLASVFDVDGNGVVNQQDNINGQPAAGRQSTVGMVQGAKVAQAQSGQQASLIECVGNQCNSQASQVDLGSDGSGRRSWRRLQ